MTSSYRHNPPRSYAISSSHAEPGIEQAFAMVNPSTLEPAFLASLPPAPEPDSISGSTPVDFAPVPLPVPAAGSGPVFGGPSLTATLGS